MFWPKLRASEWILVVFFAYIALVSHWFPERPHLQHQPLLILGSVFVLLWWLSRFKSNTVGIARDFLPLLLTLMAFREMEIFLPTSFDHRLESIWIQWDRSLLDSWRLRFAIESFGPLPALYLELCYLLVYGLPFYCLGLLYWQKGRPFVDRFLVVYLLGTLTAYALFPYFPSQPPRIVFPGLDNPAFNTVFRRLNLFILKSATIHVGVFPSAHVSSAFSAAWGMFLLFPKRKVFGWTLLLYAISVSLATIYGRYHYCADVLAGFCVSLLAAVIYRLFYAGLYFHAPRR